MKTREIGNFGERIAERYLKNKGYQILDKNYFFEFSSGLKKGEVDIIAKRGEVISFIEVKTLIKKSSWQSFVISPEEQVNFLKQRKLIKTAESWLMKNKIPLDSNWQIDTISIKIDLSSKKARIRHFQNIT